jgi:hypothetical protein
VAYCGRLCPAVQKATCVRIANASNLAPESAVLVGLTCLGMLSGFRFSVHTGPLLCELAIARQDPIEPTTIDRILDGIVNPSLQLHEALEFETLTGEFERQPYQFVEPVQEFPVLTAGFDWWSTACRAGVPLT